MQAGQGCLAPVDRASRASTTTLIPAVPALGAGKVQGKEGTQSQVGLLNFSLQAHREFQGSTFSHLLLLFSPPFITLTHFPVESQREAPDKAESQAPSAAKDLGGWGAESKGTCSQSIPWPAQHPDLSPVLSLELSPVLNPDLSPVLSLDLTLT